MRSFKIILASCLVFLLLPALILADSEKTYSQDERFIDQIYQCYLKTPKQIQPSLVLAQAILESNNGQNELANMYHNYFGIMDHQHLKKFKSMQDNVDYYHHLLVHKPYNLAKVSWGDKMKQKLSYYAQDPNYYAKLQAIYQSYHLSTYDHPNKVSTYPISLKINLKKPCYQTKMNPYVPNYYGQCTWFAWGRFYDLYHLDSGIRGDGKQCVKQLVQKHPKLFKRTTSFKQLKNGSMFSTRSGSVYGHVGIIEKYDRKKQTLIVSEGNFDHQVFHIGKYNRKEFIQRYGYGLEFGVRK